MATAARSEAYTWSELGKIPYRRMKMLDACLADSDFDVHAYRQLVSPATTTRALVGTASAERVDVHLLTAAGRRLHSLALKTSAIGRLLECALTADGVLVLVADDGAINRVDERGRLLLPASSLGDTARREGLLSARVLDNGSVVGLTTGSLSFVAVAGDGTPVALASPELEAPPASWTALSPRQARSGALEVLVSVASGSVLALDDAGVADKFVRAGPFSVMRASYDGSRVACVRAADGVLVSYAADFLDELGRFPTKIAAAPRAIEWADEAAVALHWSGLLLLVDVTGHWLRFSYDEDDGPLTLVAEADGVTVVSANAVELLQRVPDVLERTLAIASRAPSAVLLDASE